MDSIVKDWAFTTVIPCHFSGPVKASPADFKRAFTFAYEDVTSSEEAGAEDAGEGPAVGIFSTITALFGKRKEKVGGWQEGPYSDSYLCIQAMSPPAIQHKFCMGSLKCTYNIFFP